MNPRTYLYVPGDSPRRLARAHERGADAVIADLEDGVAEAGKAEAVAAVRDWLAAPVAGGMPQWVRINEGARGLDDLRAVRGPALAGVCVPKVRGPAEIEAVLAVLRDPGGTPALPAVMPIIETAAGLRRIDAIADIAGVTVLQLGELDLAADLGMTLHPDPVELLPARAAVVAASAAAGLLAPVAPVWPDFADLEHFSASTLALKRLGFGARAVIHPAQIAPVHEAFRPDDDELRQATEILQRYEAAVSDGSGVAVYEDGTMIDAAVIRTCRRIVESAR